MDIENNDINNKVDEIINNLVDNEIKNLKKLLKTQLGLSIELALKYNFDYEIDISDDTPQLYFIISDNIKFPLPKEMRDEISIYDHENSVVIELFEQELFILSKSAYGACIYIDYPCAFLNFLKFEDSYYIDEFMKKLLSFKTSNPKCIIPKSAIKNRKSLIAFFEAYLILS